MRQWRTGSSPPITWILAGGLACAAIVSLVTWWYTPDPGPSPVQMLGEDSYGPAELILLEAREEVERGVRYDASYQALSYPGGDVPSGIGACTDVVVRALRAAGFDLQVLVHEDMKERFEEYPQLWGHTGPDPNIDHRRVPNQITFFRRHGLELTVNPQQRDEWRHGDIVFWRFPNGNLHAGIISDRTNREGLPLVIHNAHIAREEDVLTRWEIKAHFRFPPGTDD